MAANRSEVLELARIRSGLTDSSPEINNSIMEIAVDEAQEIIINYINRDEIPNACKMIWTAVASDIYRYSVRDFGLDSGEDDPDKDMDLMKNVSEIRIDDAVVRDEVTSGKYTADAISSKTKKEVDFLKNYRERLHRFRLIQWRKYTD